MRIVLLTRILGKSGGDHAARHCPCRQLTWIGPEDVLTIKAWKEPELSGKKDVVEGENVQQNVAGRQRRLIVVPD